MQLFPSKANAAPHLTARAFQSAAPHPAARASKNPSRILEFSRYFLAAAAITFSACSVAKEAAKEPDLPPAKAALVLGKPKPKAPEIPKPKPEIKVQNKKSKSIKFPSRPSQTQLTGTAGHSQRTRAHNAIAARPASSLKDTLRYGDKAFEISSGCRRYYVGPDKDKSVLYSGDGNLHLIDESYSEYVKSFNLAAALGGRAPLPQELIFERIKLGPEDGLKIKANGKTFLLAQSRLIDLTTDKYVKSFIATWPEPINPNPAFGGNLSRPRK